MIKNISILIKLAFVVCFFINFSLNAQNTCDWIIDYATANLYNSNPDDDDDTISYSINNGFVNLHFCENTYNEITVNDSLFDSQINDVLWSYTTDQGQECQDWSGVNDDGDYYFSVDFNDPCIQSTESIIVDFEVSFDNDNQFQCSFGIDFFRPGDPFININNYNTNEQIAICEENLNIELFADSYATNPNSEYVTYEWFINGESIANSNVSSLVISETNYDINASNTFYYSVSNYCSGDSIFVSDWITVSIFEGYNDCEPCEWNFPDEEKSEYFGFSPNNDGLNDFFPEMKMTNNFQNRTDDSHITCQATNYKVTIYNRYGRKIFESSENNEPWDGKNNNGKVCKEGTYFYKIEYVLNPLVEQNNQDEKKVKYGSVHLAN